MLLPFTFRSFVNDQWERYFSGVSGPHSGQDKRLELASFQRNKRFTRRLCAAAGRDRYFLSIVISARDANG